MKRILSLSVASVTALLAILFTLMVLAACKNSMSDKALIESKDGIRFSTGSLEDVRSRSRKENKPVFLLAHAGYCAACKKMMATVIPEKEIGDLFNKSFINAQIDIESEEGKKAVKDYEITGTPTLLFFSPDGQVINRASGFQDNEKLIALAKGLSFKGEPVCE